MFWTCAQLLFAGHLKVLKLLTLSTGVPLMMIGVDPLLPQIEKSYCKILLQFTI